jgi:hypothetical protein
VKEYEVDPGPWDPITGSLSNSLSILQTMVIGWGNVSWGIANKAVPRKKDSSSSSDLKEKPSPTTNPTVAQELPRENTSLAIKSSHSSGDVSHEHSPDTSATLSPHEPTLSPALPTGKSDFENDSLGEPESDRMNRGLRSLVRGTAKSHFFPYIVVSQGLHNLPRLYGDTTVRSQDKVTGIQSGLQAAGRSPIFGLYDGITGVVTQPIKGAKEEGVIGFAKGVGKGIGGLVIKPIAGLHGVSGNISKGLWKEARRRGPKKGRAMIRAARFEQGIRECNELSEEEKVGILGEWRERFSE